MSKIRHLAIKTKDPARLAKFYEEVFGLKVISYRAQRRRLYERWLLTCAACAIAARRPERHQSFGFRSTTSRGRGKLAKWDEPMAERPATRPFAEYRAMDPDGNLFDISAHGYDQVELAADRDDKKKKAAEKATA
jgi:catechol 2,3-dioxygenase-like lactoylglutathione lyase family enzyme